jgi:outer membrane protein TolC
MNKLNHILIMAGLLVAGNLWADTVTTTNSWVSQPLSLLDCMNIAAQQNAAILKAKSDLEASYGLVVQTRAVALPQVTASGQYKYTEPRAIETIGGTNFPTTPEPHQNWNSGIQIVQSIYQGGKMIAAIKAARATKEEAIADYQTSVADTLLSVRVAYYDVLQTEQQITVHDASVKLLEKELEDQQHRFNAGTVPRFNVLRAEVSVANERPNLIQARNGYRIAKNNLVNLLGYNLPRDIWEDVPINLTDSLEVEPLDIKLPDAIQQALNQRTELTALRKTEELQKLNIVAAQSGYKPVVQVFAGYNWYNAQFSPPVTLDHDINGWNAGAELNWNIFDGLLTHGKVIQARAQYSKAQINVEDEARQIELQVRTYYSDFIEAKEVLDSQEKVQEEADESLREAKARAEAGTGTQLDVLDAETSLTQARTTMVNAKHDFATAKARLQRAIGADLASTTK